MQTIIKHPELGMPAMTVHSLTEKAYEEKTTTTISDKDKSEEADCGNRETKSENTT